MIHAVLQGAKRTLYPVPQLPFNAGSQEPPELGLAAASLASTVAYDPDIFLYSPRRKGDSNGTKR